MLNNRTWAVLAISILLLVVVFLLHFNVQEITVSKHFNVPSTSSLNVVGNDIFLGIEQMQMDDPMLIYMIRKFFLESPSKLPYKLDRPNDIHYAQHNQSKFVSEYFKHKRNGTYVEAGALKGESISNSFYFEKSLGWEGVLVEPMLHNQLSLRAKNRKSFFLPGCLAEKYPRRAKFECLNTGCQVISNIRSSLPHSFTDTWCFPLYSVLLAANMTRVDYLVLDLEGFEMFVLEAIPFDKLEIKLIQVESAIPNAPNLDPGRSNKFRNFFQTKWPQYKEVDFSKGSPIDILFENVNLPL